MKLLYYPGCTLKTSAKNFEESAFAAARALDVELVEIERWNCCGTVHSLAMDDLIHHLAPIRNLIRVREMGGDKVVTLCAMCYHTLKRANLTVRNDREKLDKMNRFMDREIDYDGNVEVIDMLEVLRDMVGFDTISQKVVRPLEGMKIAGYYGCMLLRPEEVALDNFEEPTVLRDLVESIGGEYVDTPYKTECCGSYQTVNEPYIVVERVEAILSSCQAEGAEAVVTACPLCFFNLDRRQKDVGFREMPIFYFTQPLALALGAGEESMGFDLHYVDPRPFLGKKKLVQA